MYYSYSYSFSNSIDARAVQSWAQVLVSCIGLGNESLHPYIVWAIVQLVFGIELDAKSIFVAVRPCSEQNQNPRTMGKCVVERFEGDIPEVPTCNDINKLVYKKSKVPVGTWGASFKMADIEFQLNSLREA